MIELGLKKKAEKEAQAQQKTKLIPVVQEEVVETLPSVVESQLPSMSLSLDLAQEITPDVIMENVKIPPRELKAGIDTYQKAKRKVSRLTTGASAALPIVCKGDLCPFKEKCVPGDTLVYTPKGYRQIKELVEGDEVYSADALGYLEVDTVLRQVLSGVKQVYKITTAYGYSVRVTSEHKVLTSVEGFKVYRSIESGLSVGDQVFIYDAETDESLQDYGNTISDTILSILPNGVEEVYDITVQTNSNFFANNILVHNCSYYEHGIHDEGGNCLVEEQLIEHWTMFYMRDLNIDTKSISELHFLSRLVEITILDLRMTNYLSINNPDLMMDFITAADLNDQPLTQKGISIAFEIKERLEKQKLKILESLNSTRERRVKTALEVANTQNSINRQGTLMARLDELARTIRSNRKEGVVIDV